MEYPLLGNLFVTSFTGKYDYLLDFLVRTLLYLFGLYSCNLNIYFT